MNKVTVTTKVSSEVARRISQIGHPTSDVMLVGLEVFLSLPLDQQAALMRDHFLKKKREKALRLYLSRTESLTK